MTRNFQAIPVKDLNSAVKDKSYFAIVEDKWPWIVVWTGSWWIDVLSRKKVYGITHILIEVDGTY